MIWFSSDLHFNHNKDFCYAPRGFSSVEEMNNTIIERWNSKVAPTDEVYILGDLMLNDLEAGLACLSKLNGQLHIILGNHDTNTRIEAYSNCKNIISIDYATQIKYGKYIAFLSHYPTLCANYDDEKKVWNLHGHTHSQEKFSTFAQCYNVALDAHDCYPVSIEEVLEDIRKKKQELNNSKEVIKNEN